MGLISELHQEVKAANLLQRLTQKAAASGPGAWVFQRTLFPGPQPRNHGQLGTDSTRRRIGIIVRISTVA